MHMVHVLSCSPHRDSNYRALSNSRPQTECAGAVTAGETASTKGGYMDKENLIRLIWSMAALIEELAPDEEFRDSFNIDVVLEEAQKTIIELRGEE